MKPSPVLVELPEGQTVEELEVETIVSHRGSGRTRLYRVKWKNFPERHNTWEPLSNLTNASELVNDYESSLIERRIKKRERRGLRPLPKERSF